MKLLKLTGTCISLFLIIGIISCSTEQSKKQSPIYDRTQVVSTADSALQLLIDGNDRFVSDSVLVDNISKSKRFTLKDKGQKPFAVIVTCSDSRVAPELLFDQGLGDLFVIRIAGNVLDSVGLGSVQYAVEHLHVPLVVILGHENCGAVTAAVQGGELPGALPAIGKRIMPSIEKVKGTGTKDDITDKVIDQNVLENVAILEKDRMVEELIKASKVKVVGAKYHLESGLVTYFKE